MPARLISSMTTALTTILGYSAMSGVIGGGGLGKIALSTAITATRPIS